MTDAINYDPLYANQFKVVFSKLPQTTIFLQGFSLPGITLNKITQPTPLLDLAQVGEKLVFEPLVLSFVVDAGMTNYREINDWMRRIAVRGSALDDRDQASLEINGLGVFYFTDVWPTQLGTLNFVANPDSPPVMTCTVTLEFDYWDFNKI